MTTYQYIHQLPRESFEVVLAGLMRLPFDSAQAKRLHTWLDEPAEEWFPILPPLDAAPENTIMSLLGREVSGLAPWQQEKLKHAMREYCEVCDAINENLAQRYSQEGAVT